VQIDIKKEWLGDLEWKGGHRAAEVRRCGSLLSETKVLGKGRKHRIKKENRRLKRETCIVCFIQKEAPSYRR